MNKDDNFSRKEEKKFSDYGESWWEDNSVAAPLHKINPLRINFIRENTDSLKNCSVLDEKIMQLSNNHPQITNKQL